MSQVISHYRIIKKLGAGGMGEVYLAEDMKLNRQVAIKFMRLDSVAGETAKKRFLREARTSAKLDHPNICSIYEIAEEGDRSFIVMQYVEGETLYNKIKRGPLSLSMSIDIALQTAEALATAHAVGIIHRDIKPQNIMITPRGQVKVLDFGLAKMAKFTGYADSTEATESQISESGIIPGTVPYMSPEQITGRPVDTRTDLFSFGATVYECVAGRPAFSGANNIEILAQIINVDPPPPSHLNPSVPSTFDRVILKALAKDVDARYQSANVMIADLRAVSDTLESPDEQKTVETVTDSTRPQGLVSRLYEVLRHHRSAFTYTVLMLAVTVLAVWLVPKLFSKKIHEPSAASLRWYERGVNALRDGSYFKASRALLEAISADNKFVLAHARLAEAWMELDYTGKASDAILQAEALAREQAPVQTLDVLYLKAINASVRRDFKQACNSYGEILRRSPDLPQIHVDLGRAYEKNDETDKAIDEFEKAAKLAPEDPTPFLHLGVLRGRKLELNGAQEAFKNAEKLYEAQTNEEGILEVYYQRGYLLNNQLRLAEAKSQFQQVLERAEGNVYQRIRALRQLSSIYSAEGDMRRGEKCVTEAVDLAQQNRMENLYSAGLIDLGNVFFYSGNYQEAEKYFKQAIEHAHGYKGLRNEMRAVLSLGSLYINQGKTEEGLEKVEQAVDFYTEGGYRKEASQALILIGQANKQKGNYDGAFEAFEQQLQLAEQVSDLSLVSLAHSNLGSLLVSKEQYPDALRHFDESFRINNLLGAQFDMGYDSLQRGSVLWQLGRYEEANKALGQAYSIADKGDNSYRKLLAEVCLEKARMALSEQEYLKVKENAAQVLQLSGKQYEDVPAVAKSALGLALTFTGAKEKGMQMCQEAFDAAKRMKKPLLLSAVSLELAVAMLENGDAASAHRVALQAQGGFQRAEQAASESRAWLVAARASRRMNNETAALEAALRARDLLLGLEQRWGTENYTAYLKRPDIQRYSKQLDAILTASK